MAETQNYQNHVRWFPLHHFLVVPLLVFNFIWQAVRLYQEPSWDRAETVLLAIGLLLLSAVARLQSLRAQDRIIRLEEHLRYKELLPPDVAEKAANLPLGTIFALRFVADEELPELARRALDGEFKDNKSLKQSIKNWRGDFLRV